MVYHRVIYYMAHIMVIIKERGRMSVLIKGMKMPKYRRECKMLTYHSTSGCLMCDISGNALARNFKPIPFDGIPDWCPLIEVPEPHGDLINRDALKADICPEWNGLYVPDNAYSEKLIYNTPPVIEAEGR